MLLNKKNPVTPSLRHKLMVNKSLLFSVQRLKNKTFRKKKFAGTNFDGHICISHRGGGAKKIIREITWFKNNFNGIVTGIEYDPNRTSFIARVFDLNTKTYVYVIAQKNLFPGSRIQMGLNHKSIRIGNKLSITQIPAGSIISLVSLNKKMHFAVAAGTSCQLVQKGLTLSKIRLPSGKFIFIDSKSFASIGSVSNDKNNLQVFGNAGTTRHLGMRPRVRGVAMNPIDHPHGGGGGKPSVTPWGKPTKGKPTRKKIKH